MTRVEFEERLKEFFDSGLALMCRKNNDYAGKEDPFANFRHLGDERCELGLITRITDKWARLKNSLDVTLKNESVDDTLMDLANYAAILYVWRNRNVEKK